MRWRPPTRWLILITLLLLVGAVVNVAVAWVLVGAPDSWTPGGPRRGLQLRADQVEEVARRLGAPRVPHQGVMGIGLGWTAVGVIIDDERWLGFGLRGGWPRRSMRLAMIYDASETPWTYPASLKPPRRLLPGPEWFEYPPRNRIPLAPIPTGFAINTIFYAAILALPLSFFPIRRRLRARHGRCSRCGYDRAGLAGADPGAPCPECGAAR